MRSPSALAALAALVLVCVSPTTAVWCVGEDHAALEWSGDGCCDEPAPASAQADLAAADGCGPCLDVTLDREAVAPTVASVPTGRAPATLVSPPSAVAATRPLAVTALGANGLDGTCLRL